MNPAKILVPKHHSVSDWDFQAGLVYNLSELQYVSAPTSLRFGNYPNSTVKGGCLCRVDSTLCLPDGRLITALYNQDRPNNAWIYFRNQSPLGSCTYTNTYFINFITLQWCLDDYRAGVWHRLGSQDYDHSADVWEWWRLTWYSGLDPGESPALVVTMEKWVEGAWVQQGDPIYHTADRWKDSEVNRCGPAVHPASSAWQLFWDDTEIYGPAG